MKEDKSKLSLTFYKIETVNEANAVFRQMMKPSVATA